jgi:hypothetical protein
MAARFLCGRGFASQQPFTRRALVGSALVGGASLAVSRVAAPLATATSAIGPGSWRTWLLSSSDALRPANPAPPTPDELRELVELQGERTAGTLATITQWDDPTVVLPWTTLTLDLIRVHSTNPVRAARALALLHVALYDTLVATGNARGLFPPRARGQQVPGPVGACFNGGVVIPFGPRRGGRSRIHDACLTLPAGVGRDVCGTCRRGSDQSAPGGTGLPQ